MPARTPVATHNLDGYGNPPLTWERALASLQIPPGPGSIAMFLTTVSPDGSPHSTGIGAIWHDGDFYFTSGPNARKTRYLAANPAVTLAFHTPDMDLTIDGAARRVTDSATLAAIAAQYREIGWPADVAGDALTAPFSAPSAGPAPWYVYRLTVRSVVGLSGAEPYGATRWDFTVPAPEVASPPTGDPGR